ncbi:hypothetical protein ACJ2A9_10245 [Anaerobacillus sp. MEB173]|uniref:hypothetical protein n=1 Tax=Anaerobacillus sp. MEB173 TaxID=3383345 RepID=UPI003F926C5B
MKNSMIVVLSTVALLLLSGCFYPSEQRAENQIPYEDQIVSVQSAVNQFRKDTGVLPIKTRDMETPIYQKYPIDFGQLVPRYMQNAPGNSFENGGVFQYVLINVETDPEVKLIDLVTLRYIQELQMKVNQYRSQHQFAPVAEVLDVGIFALDVEQLGYKEPPTVRSPFFPDHQLPLIIDNRGTVVVDYTIDLLQALENYDHSFDSGDDIRSILVDNSHFVPVFSLSYTIEDGRPTFLRD